MLLFWVLGSWKCMSVAQLYQNLEGLFEWAKGSLYLFLLLLLLLSHFSHVQPSATHRRQLTRLPRPWDSPGKSTDVGCHFLLQCMKVKSESEVGQLCPTLRNAMDCSLPGSSIHGIFRARVLEWGAIAFSMYLFLKNWNGALGLLPSFFIFLNRDYISDSAS